jgi:hypothetical protein
MDNVKVITAGGAAKSTGGKKNKKKRNNKKQSPALQDITASAAGDAVAGATDANEATFATSSEGLQNESPDVFFALELESSSREEEDALVASRDSNVRLNNASENSNTPLSPWDKRQVDPVEPLKIEDLYQEPPQSSKKSELFWLFFCFLGIMASFVCYGLLLEYTVSGGRKLHELSFLFVTSGLYTLTAAAGRYVRAETPTTIPPARFAILGLTSMGSTFCSVRSLR